MSQGQFTVQEVEETQTIAKLRIHIERHIRRVTEFHIFDGVIPLSMVGSINQIWTVTNMLTLSRRMGITLGLIESCVIKQKRFFRLGIVKEICKCSIF